jgi:short-subunit dehydrogenase
MNRTAKGTALVTGASGGIGEELARLIAADGRGLVLVARSRDRLQKLAEELNERHGVEARVIRKDLTSASAPQEIFDELAAAGITIEMLINNAGFGSYGLFAEINLRRELDLLQVNVVALTHLAKLFLPGMIARRRGYLMNVASTAAFQPGPLMAVYYASKAYVLSFSEALANEAEGTGVVVSALCPGPTETGFVAAAEMQESKLFERSVMSAREVAEVGYRGMLAGRAVVIPGLRNSLVARTVGFFPRGLVTKAVRRVQERRGR